MNGPQKQLKQEYRQMKPAMGVLPSNPGHAEVLSGGNHKSQGSRQPVHLSTEFRRPPKRELQKDWQKSGQERFVIKTIDELPYAEDQPTKDYRDEVQELQEMWVENSDQRVLIHISLGTITHHL